MTATNQKLYDYNNELQAIGDSVLALLLKPQIATFYRNHGVRIQSIVERRGEIVRKHFEMDGDDVRFEGEGEERKPVFKEGSTLESYNAELKELMDRQIEIKL
ncbi:MAG TPA: hypothetical protein VEY71_07040 [Chitinophagales bacterium]|nr:hypothetical protein [Chitinophagales bacterium]